MARHAFLIGVSEFVDKRLARLNAPTNDVIALRGILQDGARGGFDSVDLSLNEDFLGVRDHLSSFFDDRSPDDVLLLYHSGYGILARGNRLFLATSGSNLDTPRTRSIAAQEIRDFIEESRAQRQIVVLDCCHSGAFAEHAKAAVPAPAVTPSTFSSGDAGLYVLTAADTLQFAWDGAELRAGNEPAGGFSQFTSWLVEGLEKGAAAPDDEQITMDALYRYLFRRARSEGTATTPQRFVQGGVGDLVISANPLMGSSQIDPMVTEALAAVEFRTRLGAVAELTLQMEEVHTVASRAARRLLQRHLEGERDYQVRRAITRALGESSNRLPEAARPVDEEQRRAEAAREAEGEKRRAEAARQAEEESRRTEAPRQAVGERQRAGAVPRVFISYSHDGPAHEDSVLAIANRLRAEGIDALIDQYVQFPPEGWPTWCEAEIRKAGFVLMICTETYMRRVDGTEEPGKGHGVLWEARLIRQYLYEAGSVSAKFVPVLLIDGSPEHIPMPVRGGTIYRVERSEGYEALYRFLTNQPQIRMPEIGKLRRLPERQRQWVGDPPPAREPEGAKYPAEAQRTEENRYHAEAARGAEERTQSPSRSAFSSENVSKTMSNPRYDDDLSRLDRVFQRSSVMNRETIILVVGTGLPAELLDRPVAELLRDHIDERGGKANPFRRAIVVTDQGWYAESKELANKAVIAIGGPSTNMLSAEFDKLPEGKYPIPGTEALIGFFSKKPGNRPQVALWGETASGSREAVEHYLRDDKGLNQFLKMVWR